MRIYRIAQKKYLEDLRGEGARLFGGRWNKQGTSMLYFSEHLSLAVLEILVHLDYQFLTAQYNFMIAEVPDKTVKNVSIKSLPSNWRHNPPSSNMQDFGSNWLKEGKNLGLKVPSAVLPEERNILINPNHKSFSELKILKTGPLDIDPRMIKVK